MAEQHPTHPQQNQSARARASVAPKQATSAEERKAPKRFLSLSPWTADDNYRGSHRPVGNIEPKVGAQEVKASAEAALKPAVVSKSTRAGAKSKPESAAAATARASKSGH